MNLCVVNAVTLFLASGTFWALLSWSGGCEGCCNTCRHSGLKKVLQTLIFRLKKHLINHCYSTGCEIQWQPFEFMANKYNEDKTIGAHWVNLIRRAQNTKQNQMTLLDLALPIISWFFDYAYLILNLSTLKNKSENELLIIWTAEFTGKTHSDTSFQCKKNK